MKNKETITRIMKVASDDELFILANAFRSYEYWNSEYKKIMNKAHNQNPEGKDYSKEIKSVKKNKKTAKENFEGVIQLLSFKYPPKQKEKRHK